MPHPLFIPGYSLDSRLESRQATIFIGWYTFVLHFLVGFYFLDVFRGSNSDWVASPLFEYSNGSMRTAAAIVALYSFLFMLFGSLGLIRGVKTASILLNYVCIF